MVSQALLFEEKFYQDHSINSPLSLRSEKNNWTQFAELVLLYICAFIYKKIFIPNTSIKTERGKVNS